MNKYLKGGCRCSEARLFLAVPSDRRKGNGQKLEHRRFCLNISKHFSTAKATEHWHRLPREVAESPSSETIKTHLNLFLGNQL